MRPMRLCGDAIQTLNKISLLPNYLLSGSLICGNMLSLETDIRALEKGGIDSIHFDVMDSIFVPRLGLHPEILKATRSITQLPIDVHLMMHNPEPYLPIFIENGGTCITVHAEATQHLHRLIQKIRSLGAKAGVALNPSTPLSVLDFILDDIDLVLVMAINPGVVGHPLIPNTLKKIALLKEKIADHSHIQIEIDGGVTFESAPKMIAAGASMLVCGSATIFKPAEKIEDKIHELRSQIDHQLR